MSGQRHQKVDVRTYTDRLVKLNLLFVGFFCIKWIQANVVVNKFCPNLRIISHVCGAIRYPTLPSA